MFYDDNTISPTINYGLIKKSLSFDFFLATKVIKGGTSEELDEFIYACLINSSFYTGLLNRKIEEYIITLIIDA